MARPKRVEEIRKLIAANATPLTQRRALQVELAELLAPQPLFWWERAALIASLVISALSLWRSW